MNNNRNTQPEEQHPIEFKLSQPGTAWELKPVDYAETMTASEAQALAKEWANIAQTVTRWNYKDSPQGHYVHPDNFYSIPTQKGSQTMITPNTPAQQLQDALNVYNKATNANASIYKTPGGWWHIVSPDFSFLFNAPTRRELAALIAAWLDGYREGKRAR